MKNAALTEDKSIIEYLCSIFVGSSVTALTRVRIRFIVNESGSSISMNLLWIRILRFRMSHKKIQNLFNFCIT